MHDNVTLNANDNRIYNLYIAYIRKAALLYRPTLVDLEKLINYTGNCQKNVSDHEECLVTSLRPSAASHGEGTTTEHRTSVMRGTSEEVVQAADRRQMLSPDGRRTLCNI